MAFNVIDYTSFDTDYNVVNGQIGNKANLSKPTNRLKKEVNNVYNVQSILTNQPCIAWSSVETYLVGELVSYATKNWRAKLSTTDAPPSENLNWEEVTSADFGSSSGSFVINAGTVDNSVVSGDIVYYDQTSTSYLPASTSLANNVMGVWNDSDNTITSTGVVVNAAFAAFSKGDILVLDPLTDGKLKLFDANSGTNVIIGIALGNANVLLKATGSGSSGSGTVAITNNEFVATQDQTTFTVSYTIGSIDVLRNGKHLIASDFNATNGTTVVLTSPANVNDVIVVKAYSEFSIADTYTKSEINTLVDEYGGVKIVSTAINYMANKGELVACDTSGGPLATGATKFTITLPATPTNGDMIQIADAYGEAQEAPILINPNGKNINNLTDNLTLDVNYFDIKLIYRNDNWSISGK